MKKRILSILLALCMVMTFVPTTAWAAEEEKVAPVLSTNIGEKTFKVGIPTEFEFSTVAHDYVGEMVLGTSNFSDEDAIEKLEYYEVKDGNWYELPGDFGPSTGFAMGNATSKFRVTFKTAGNYSFTASMKSAAGGEVLCSTFVEFTVSEKVAPELTTDIEDQTFKVGVPTEFTFTTKANDYAGVKVLGTSNFSDEDAIEKLEYYEVKDGNWYELPGDFGPSTGFAMGNATSKFRVTFKTAGNYSFTASMKSAAGGETLCNTFVEFTVSEKVAPELTTDIEDQTFKVGVPTEFTFTTKANDYAGVKVLGTSNFSDEDAIEKLEYYEVKDEQWHEFSGDFGPSTGFPLGDFSSKFRVTFKTVGEYNFTASVKTASGGEVLCSTNVAFTVSHDLTKIDAKAPTCTAVGNIEYWHCACCDKCFSDEDGTTEISKESTVTNALGHAYGPWYVVSYPTYGERRDCVRCDHYEFTPIYVPPYIPPVQSPKDNWPFIDVDKTDDFYKDVKYVYEHDLMLGVTDDTFAPYEEFTRAMVATILYRLEKEPATEFRAVFGDVLEHNWFAEAVTWGNDSGILLGYNNGNFGPNDSVTMEQLLTILYRYAESEDYDVSARGELDGFKDSDAISAYAVDAVSWAVAEDLISAEGYLAPRVPAARWQVAEILANFCENILK